MKRRNGEIDALKFLFAAAIMIYHGWNYLGLDQGLFAAGYMGVEFFFVTSGFFLAAHVVRRGSDSDETPLAYAVSRYKFFFVWQIIAFVASFIVLSIIYHWSAGQMATTLVRAIPEILLLQQSGLMLNPTYVVNGITWYLSALLLVSFIAYWLIRKFGKSFLCFGAPLVSLLVLGYFVHAGGFSNPWGWTGFFYHGFLRALAEMFLGCFIYGVVSFTELEGTWLGKMNAKLAGALKAALVVFLVVLATGGGQDYLFIFLIVVCALMFVMQMRPTALPDRLNEGFIYLGRLSLPVFLNQLWCWKLMDYFLGFGTWNPALAIGVYSMVVVVLSAIEMAIINAVRKR